ncbi:hypothetical protein IEQ34_007023 [Dendrobium chrysotoxum]|uniref:Uncharacterized protein n=1 Tax=Dendrobium chrysotoxum TaxID=161865 RepID=A0AAV7H8N9_DENCH|nr:hypothetical protein IEQ34_007023 [Dendrobium chrysotoxum]
MGSIGPLPPQLVRSLAMSTNLLGRPSEVHQEGHDRLSVLAFGEWDGKVGLPDYSIDFSRIQEHRRQNKSRFEVSILFFLDQKCLEIESLCDSLTLYLTLLK